MEDEILEFFTKKYVKDPKAYYSTKQVYDALKAKYGYSRQFVVTRRVNQLYAYGLIEQKSKSLWPRLFRLLANKAK